MRTFDTYRTSIPRWATSLEVVAEIPVEGEETFELSLETDTSFLVAVVSTPNGTPPPWPEDHLHLRDPGGNYREERMDNGNFEDIARGLFIINQPIEGAWIVHVRSIGRFPFAVNAMAFHPVVEATSPRVIPWPSGSPPFKCRACKSIAKALALSIVVAATLPALPRALIDAVVSFLGVVAMVAGAFIGSVIGDTAGVIAEKLCTMVGLC